MDEVEFAYRYDVRKRLFEIENRAALLVQLMMLQFCFAAAFLVGWFIHRITSSDNAAALSGLGAFVVVFWWIAEKSKVEYPHIATFPGYPGPFDELTENDLAAMGEDIFANEAPKL